MLCTHRGTLLLVVHSLIIHLYRFTFYPQCNLMYFYEYFYVHYHTIIFQIGFVLRTLIVLILFTKQNHKSNHLLLIASDCKYVRTILRESTVSNSNNNVVIVNTYARHN